MPCDRQRTRTHSARARQAWMRRKGCGRGRAPRRPGRRSARRRRDGRTPTRALSSSTFAAPRKVDRTAARVRSGESAAVCSRSVATCRRSKSGLWTTDEKPALAKNRAPRRQEDTFDQALADFAAGMPTGAGKDLVPLKGTRRRDAYRSRRVIVGPARTRIRRRRCPTRSLVAP